jgi:hypothetical protein
MERPIVEVVLSIGGADFRTPALIDTGAPRNIFSRGCAEALALDLMPPHAEARVHHLLGQSWNAVTVHVTITPPPFTDLHWQAEVDFLLADWDMPFGILGTEGFLDRWAVTFNRYGNYFAVQEVSGFESSLPVDPWVEFQRDWDGWDRLPG